MELVALHMPDCIIILETMVTESKRYVVWLFVKKKLANKKKGRYLHDMTLTQSETSEH